MLYITYKIESNFTDVYVNMDSKTLVDKILYLDLLDEYEYTLDHYTNDIIMYDYYKKYNILTTRIPTDRLSDFEEYLDIIRKYNTFQINNSVVTWR